jgi:hypothetical protein
VHKGNTRVRGYRGSTLVGGCSRVHHNSSAACCNAVWRMKNSHGMDKLPRAASREERNLMETGMHVFSPQETGRLVRSLRGEKDACITIARGSSGMRKGCEMGGY